MDDNASMKKGAFYTIFQKGIQQVLVVLILWGGGIVRPCTADATSPSTNGGRMPSSCVGSATGGCSGAETTYFQALSDRMDEINCSNILQAISEYFMLSGKVHSLMGLSMGRLSLHLSRGNTVADGDKDTELTNLVNDMDQAQETMGKIEDTLLDLTVVIRRVLPTCLKQ